MLGSALSKFSPAPSVVSTAVASTKGQSTGEDIDPDNLSDASHAQKEADDITPEPCKELPQADDDESPVTPQATRRKLSLDSPEQTTFPLL